MTFPHPSRESIITFLLNLREKIIGEFESIENGKKFEKIPWKYKESGGGEIALLRGKHFEKAAVNRSGVGGSYFPLDTSFGKFFATGISIITHMTNPHAPTAHMNIRFIETSKGYWFGGGYDLTPMGFPYAEDTRHFHETAKSTLDVFDVSLYKKFSQNAKEYFTIPHYGTERGVGGIFFDHFRTDNFEEDRRLWEQVGLSFIQAVMPIYQRRLCQNYSEGDREKQLKFRGRYAEFNLLYDRGTKFGFQSGGNPEAILCSMPPLVTW